MTRLIIFKLFIKRFIQQIRQSNSQSFISYLKFRSFSTFIKHLHVLILILSHPNTQSIQHIYSFHSSRHFLFQTLLPFFNLPHLLFPFLQDQLIVLKERVFEFIRPDKHDIQHLVKRSNFRVPNSLRDLLLHISVNSFSQMQHSLPALLLYLPLRLSHLTNFLNFLFRFYR